MSDIVERLHTMPSSLNDAIRTMEEAADEIERLRHDLKEADEALLRAGLVLGTGK